MPIAPATVVRTSILLLVLAMATSLRVLDFPSLYSIRDMDETGYCHGCLQLIEGITPGNKAAPGGPLYWAGWVYAACETARDIIAPQKPAAPAELRPFVALNRVLFENYRDVSSLHRSLVILNVALSLIGTATAVGLGFRIGGAVGGLVMGGLFATVPVFLNLSEMCRPYSMAWSFAIVSLYFASFADRGGRRWWIPTAIFLGLSIGSRIEMLCLIPLIWWMFSIHDQSLQAPARSVRFFNWRRRVLLLLKLTIVSLCIAAWISPWLITHLIGNLRTIATVRFSTVASPAVAVAVKDCAFNQALGPVILLAMVGIFFQPAGLRLRFIIPFIYVLLLSASMLLGYADGIHQHGAVLIAWPILLAMAAGPMLARWPKPLGTALAIALLFPLSQAIEHIRFNQSLEDHEDSVAWVEQHVPAGTTVYLIDGGCRSLLPTPAAATALWSEVTDDRAWRKKMEFGLRRFQLSADELPRALSEENLIQERSNRRKWFILGGCTQLPIPRFNIKLATGSPVFGVADLGTAMKLQPGILIWRNGFPVDPPTFLGPPMMQWISREGSGVRIYCSPEIRERVRRETSKFATSNPSNG